MKTIHLFSESCRRLEAPPRAYWKAMRGARADSGDPSLPHYTKPSFLARILRRRGAKIATFGSAELIHRRDGRWELRGGPPTDHAAAREWCSLFQHETTFSSSPLPTSEQAPDTSDKAHPRILIADDDPVVRESLAAVLESEGYVVDQARNGIEAVTRAIEHLPKLVLLDLNMPHWDGWEAFSRLDRVTPLLPVIVITARPNQYKEAVRLGVDAFMEKPLNIPELMRAIEHLISEDRNRHFRRVTNPGFVTELLGSAES